MTKKILRGCNVTPALNHPNCNSVTELGTFGRLGQHGIPLDPFPESGPVACFNCPKKRADFVGYYEPPEAPGIITKYGLCRDCTFTVMHTEDAATASRELREALAAEAVQFGRAMLAPRGAK